MANNQLGNDNGTNDSSAASSRAIAVAKDFYQHDIQSWMYEDLHLPANSLLLHNEVLPATTGAPRPPGPASYCNHRYRFRELDLTLSRITSEGQGFGEFLTKKDFDLCLPYALSHLANLSLRVKQANEVVFAARNLRHLWLPDVQDVLTFIQQKFQESPHLLVDKWFFWEILAQFQLHQVVEIQAVPQLSPDFHRAQALLASDTTGSSAVIEHQASGTETTEDASTPEEDHADTLSSSICDSGEDGEVDSHSGNRSSLTTAATTAIKTPEDAVETGEAKSATAATSGMMKHQEEEMMHSKNSFKYTIPKPIKNEVLQKNRKFEGRQHWSQRLETWWRRIFLATTELEGKVDDNHNQVVGVDEEEEHHGDKIQLPSKMNTAAAHKKHTYFQVVFPRYLTFHGVVASALRAKNTPYCPRECQDAVLQMYLRLKTSGMAARDDEVKITSSTRTAGEYSTSPLDGLPSLESEQENGRQLQQHERKGKGLVDEVDHLPHQIKQLELIEVGPHYGDCMLWAVAFVDSLEKIAVRRKDKKTKLSLTKNKVTATSFGFDIDQKIVDGIRKSIFLNDKFADKVGVRLAAITDGVSGLHLGMMDKNTNYATAGEDYGPGGHGSSDTTGQERRDAAPSWYVKTLDQLLLGPPRSGGSGPRTSNKRTPAPGKPSTGTSTRRTPTLNIKRREEQQEDYSDDKHNKHTILKIHVVGKLEHRILYGAKEYLFGPTSTVRQVILHIDYPHVLKNAVRFLADGDEHLHEGHLLHATTDLHLPRRSAAATFPEEHKESTTGAGFQVFQLLLKGLTFPEFHELRRLYYMTLRKFLERRVATIMSKTRADSGRATYHPSDAVEVEQIAEINGAKPQARDHVDERVRDDNKEIRMLDAFLAAEKKLEREQFGGIFIGNKTQVEADAPAVPAPKNAASSREDQDQTGRQEHQRTASAARTSSCKMKIKRRKQHRTSREQINRNSGFFRIFDHQILEEEADEQLQQEEHDFGSAKDNKDYPRTSDANKSKFHDFTEFYFNLHPRFLPDRLLHYFFHSLEVRQVVVSRTVGEALA
ncbi:unnamed protein product [Amoebophrya sp. A120]|nr:unnamed protein product [Amoebophrya sp. A120]|eukprot:GSA120T00025843001.1